MDEEIIYVGIDPGKQKDSFAVVRTAVRQKKIYVLGAKRWTGKAYLQVEEELSIMHEKRPADLYVVEKNNTGEHVIEVLRYQKHLPVRGVTTVRALKTKSKSGDTMDKNEMVGWMLKMKDAHRLIFPEKDTTETAELKRQLSIFEENTTPAGSVSYCAPGSEHDDYVIALMLACFEAKKRLRPSSGRHFAVSGGKPSYHHRFGASSGYGLQSLGRTIRYPDGSFS